MSIVDAKYFNMTSLKRTCEKQYHTQCVVLKHDTVGLELGRKYTITCTFDPLHLCDSYIKCYVTKKGFY